MGPGGIAHQSMRDCIMRNEIKFQIVIPDPKKRRNQSCVVPMYIYLGRMMVLLERFENPQKHHGSPENRGISHLVVYAGVPILWTIPSMV